MRHNRLWVANSHREYSKISSRNGFTVRMQHLPCLASSIRLLRPDGLGVGFGVGLAVGFGVLLGRPVGFGVCGLADVGRAVDGLGFSSPR